MAQLPAVTIPDASIPRLRAALRERMNDPTGTMTDGQLYKAWVAMALKAEIVAYESGNAVEAAIQSLPAPPDVT